MGKHGDLRTREGLNEEVLKKGEELLKGAYQKVLNLLTMEQRATLKEIQGEPFKGEIRP